MPYSIDQILAEIVYFDCRHPKTKQLIECGTCFSAIVNGRNKLVTTARIPWHANSRIPFTEQLEMYWKTDDGTRGRYYPHFIPHTQGAPIDYAKIGSDYDLLPPGQSKPQPKSFAINDEVRVGMTLALFGHPTLSCTSAPDSGWVTGRIVDIVDQSLPSGPVRSLVVDCATGSGYPGGPVFELIDSNTVGDAVLGLIDRPLSLAEVQKAKISYGTLVFSAASFN